MPKIQKIVQKRVASKVTDPTGQKRVKKRVRTRRTKAERFADSEVFEELRQKFESEHILADSPGYTSACATNKGCMEYMRDVLRSRCMFKRMMFGLDRPGVTFCTDFTDAYRTFR